MIFQNTNEKKFWISALKFFVAFWGLRGICSLPYLWHYLLGPQEAQKASRKPPGSYKKFQGRIPEIFWMKLIFHQDILKLTDLYRVIRRDIFYVAAMTQHTSRVGRRKLSPMEKLWAD